MGKELDIQEFMVMLHELDAAISKSITIKAIGGFAVILNSKALGLEVERKSKDLDSLTKTWESGHDNLGYGDIMEIVELNKKIDNIVWEIGNRHGCSESDGWLNNSWYDSKLFNDELEKYVEWIEYTEEKFAHISLMYADLESLFLFKMRAINDIVSGKSSIHQEVRNNDVYDVLNILKIFNEKDVRNIKHPKLALALSMYEPAVEWIAENARLF